MGNEFIHITIFNNNIGFASQLYYQRFALTTGGTLFEYRLFNTLKKGGKSDLMPLRACTINSLWNRLA